MKRDKRIVGSSCAGDHATTISVAFAVELDAPFQLPGSAVTISQSLFGADVELAWTGMNKVESLKASHNRSHTGWIYQINSDGSQRCE